MLVKVTQEHIKKGRPGECNACPIKLAFEELGYSVKVDTKELWHNNHRYALPKPAIHFIEDYDNDREVEVFEFEMVLNV